jgi:hypothetical protein
MNQQRPRGPGAGRPAGPISLVLGPAQREELAEVLGCYREQWMIIGPAAGGQWYALPRHPDRQPRPGAVTVARVLRGHAPSSRRATGNPAGRLPLLTAAPPGGTAGSLWPCTDWSG